ncbi:hypothetical protein sphantq_04427 (plasmid) [Sphingobium sp. AntQ-1]|nr:hypothetical protein sphantq_04427 [Sphingobium sp. AntQ-1]
MDDFYAARSRTIPPLPWSNIAPPFSLFAGNEGGAHTWAVLASLLQTAKLNGLDPYTWLSDVLARMVSGEVLNNDLDQLLAWNWRAAEPTAMRLAA